MTTDKSNLSLKKVEIESAQSFCEKSYTGGALQDLAAQVAMFSPTPLMTTCVPSRLRLKP